MSALDLTVDFADNAAEYGISSLPSKQGKFLGCWTRFAFGSSDKRPAPSRSVRAGGTDYSDAKVATILRDFLQPDTKLTLKEAAISLLALIPANASGYGEVCSFGEICVELAEQIPYHHPSQQKLAQLLRYLSGSPKFMYKYSITPQEEYYRAYQLLWESICDSYSAPQAESPNVWVNLNAFMANLFATGVMGNSPGKSIETLRVAFEWKKPEETWERDCNTMAAAQWIIWHGQTLFKLMIYDSPKENGERGPWWFGEAFADPPMQPRSIERWRFWKSEFEAVEKEPDASEECKTLAKRAARFMASLEETMFF